MRRRCKKIDGPPMASASATCKGLFSDSASIVSVYTVRALRDGAEALLARASAVLMPLSLTRTPAPLHVPAMVKGKKRKMITKKMLQLTDKRLKRNQEKDAEEAAEREANDAEVTHVKQAPSNLFFSYNTNLGPPFHVLMDTNFINFSIQNKLEVGGASVRVPL